MKLKLRLVLDLCMAVVLVICMNYQTTGNLPHEILGTALFLGIIIHIVANRKYYKAMIKKFKAKNEKSGKNFYFCDKRFIVGSERFNAVQFACDFKRRVRVCQPVDFGL